MIPNERQVTRLLRYKNAISRLKSLGFAKVFSDNLADMVGVTGQIVRKDFSLLGISGKRKGGYAIDDLLAEINRILGETGVQKFIIVGVGHLGTALLRYGNFERHGIRVVAGFDSDPFRVERESPVPILPMDDLVDFVRREGVRMAILAVPESAAQSAFERLRAAGVRGVLNFTPAPLRGPDGIVVHHVNLALEMENLIYFVNALDRRRLADGETPDESSAHPAPSGENDDTAAH